MRPSTNSSARTPKSAAARRLIDRKLESTRGLPPEQRTRRLAGLLARKGYPAGLAFRVIREALEAEGDLAFPEDEPPFDESDLRYGVKSEITASPAAPGSTLRTARPYRQGRLLGR